MILVFASLLALAPPEPCAALHLATTGFPDGTERKLAARAAEDLRTRGILVCADAPLAPSPECLAQTTCARDILRGADARWLVVVELLRGGAAVQVAAQLFVADGRKELDVELARGADAVMRGEQIVPDDVLAALVHAREAVAREPAPAGTSDAAPPTTTSTTNTPPLVAQDQPDATVAAEDGMPPLAVGGVIAVGAGLLAVLIGGAGAIGELGVIQDPSSTGEAKESAAVLVPVLTTAALVGLVAAGAGGVLLWLGFQDRAPD